MHIEGSNVRPAGDESEAEARERKAEEAEHYARLFANSPHANLRKLAKGYQNRAIRLRTANQFSALVRQT